MRKLGYGDQPYLVYKHTDIDRHHIHIVGLRVDESGRPLNDRFEHRRSNQITRELERKYGLHPAERKERAERPELKKVDYTAGDVKHQIGNTVKAACYGYRFQSFGEYKALLATYNIYAPGSSPTKSAATTILPASGTFKGITLKPVASGQ